MNLKREIAYLIFEIIFCIFFIIYGYYIWNNFDASSYLIAKSYDNKKEIMVDINDNEGIVLSNDEEIVKPNILYLHNISSKNSVSKLIIKIEKDNILFKNNTILKINDKYYDLEELDYNADNNYIYIILDEYPLAGYETKELEIKILTKDKIETNLGDYLNYEFISQI